MGQKQDTINFKCGGIDILYYLLFVAFLDQVSISMSLVMWLQPTEL